MAITPLNLPDASAVNHLGGDVEYLTPDDQYVYGTDNRPGKNLAYRDLLLESKLNEVITVLNATSAYDVIVGTGTGEYATVKDALDAMGVANKWSILVREGTWDDSVASTPTPISISGKEVFITGESKAAIWIPVDPTTTDDPTANNNFTNSTLIINNITVGAADNSTDWGLCFITSTVVFKDYQLQGKGSSANVVGNNMLRFYQCNVISHNATVSNYPDCDSIFGLLGDLDDQTTQNSQSYIVNTVVTPQLDTIRRIPNIVYTRSAVNVVVDNVRVNQSGVNYTLDTSLTAHATSPIKTYWGGIITFHGVNLSLRNLNIHISDPNYSGRTGSYFDTNSILLVYGGVPGSPTVERTENIEIDNIKVITTDAAWGVDTSDYSPVLCLAGDYV